MHRKYISGAEKRKKRKLCADAAQKGSLTLFHVGFRRYESLTPGRAVEQSAPFGSSSPRSSESNDSNQLVETEQSGIISLSSGFGEDLAGDNNDVETQQQGNIEEIEIINSTSTLETLQNVQINVITYIYVHTPHYHFFRAACNALCK